MALSAERKWHITVLYIDGCHAVGRINYSQVTPVSRQTQSDGYSDIYFDVAMRL